MIIKCTKRVAFTHPENPQVNWEMKPGFIGEVPKWVEKDWYFIALCNDGTITEIKSKSDRDIQNAAENPSEPPKAPAGAENTNEPPADKGGKKDNGGKK